MFIKAATIFRRHASRSYGRVLLISAAVVIVAVAAFRIVTPFLISDTMVRKGIEDAVEQWTGHEATIGGISIIRFWPHPKVTLTDITIHRDVAGEHKVLATIDEMSASFNLLEALLNKAGFEDFHLFNPHVYLDRGSDGRLHWAHGGLLVNAIGKAIANGDQQSLPQELNASMGEVRVSNGVIEIASEADVSKVRIDEINGRLGWPHLADPASIRAQAMVGGRKVSVDLRSTQPLLLIDGRSGEFQGSASSDIGQAKFDGVASLTKHGYFSGDAELQVSNMADMLRWFDVNPALVDGLQTLSVAAKVIADRQELRFENLTLGLNDEQATGLMELDTPASGQPRLTGTLAFNHIDLLRLLAALKPAISKNADALPTLVGNMELDLRISSQIAAFGGIQIRDIALGLMNVAQQFRLDILDSDLQPGRLTGRISTIKEARGKDTISEEDDGQGIAFRAAVRGADFSALAQQLQLKAPIPAAQGSLDVAIDVPQPIDRDAWYAATGTFNFRAGPGRLTGINMTTIRQLMSQKLSFRLADASAGAIDFDSINASAVIRDGIANIDKAEILGHDETITLTGAVPLATRGLALSTTVAPKDGSAPLGFFVGGAWPSPIFWPMAAPVLKPSE
jgi:AsmA protein